MTTAQKDKEVQCESRYDLVVAGGGYVGLSLALAIRQATDLSILVVEPQQIAKMRKDERASAIAAAATRMLRQLGVWDTIAPDAQPINDMIVTDSKLQDVVRPALLTFEGNTEDGQPFAHMIPNGVMVGALSDAATRAGVTILEQDSVKDFVDEGASMTIELTSGVQVEASLLVAADGVRSRLRDLAGISTINFKYDQVGIVTTVEHERPS